MNLPPSTVIDSAQAARLCAACVESYQPEPALAGFAVRMVQCEAAATRAVIFSSETERIVAFRGSAAARDWLLDFESRKTELYWAPGRVHRGFNTAVESMSVELDAALPPGAPGRLWITGHSLGGAMAMLFALRLAARRKMEVAGVVTFGQPRVGSYRFARGYNAALGNRTLRFVHAGDVVPHLPPVAALYFHAGRAVRVGRPGLFWREHPVRGYLHSFSTRPAAAAPLTPDPTPA